MADDHEAAPPRRPARSARELALRDELIQVRSELQQLLAALDRAAEVPAQQPQTAVITSVVSRPSLLKR